MACWTASAKWAGGPALDGRRDMPLALRLSEGLGVTFSDLEATESYRRYALEVNTSGTIEWHTLRL